MLKISFHSFFFITFFLILASNSLKAEDFQQEASTFIKTLKKSFMKELKAGIKKGPYDAIDFCHLKAPHLIEHKKSEKFLFGRSSLKYRSYQNKPKDWLVPILKEYENSNGKKPRASQVYKVHSKSVYVEPIYIKPVCLTCHGQPKGSVKKRLQSLYPKDKATGYKLGEFRGLFWVKEK